MRSWLKNLRTFRSEALAGGRPRPPRRGVRLLLESLEPRTLLSVSLFVDDSNATGMADGSATKPFTTIQAAVDAAAAVPDDAIIRVAQGTYSENVVLPDKSVQLLGGFAGGTASAYANGQPGDFAAATPSVNVTNIVGASGAPVLSLNNLTAQTFVIDGFSIRGGLHGVYCSANPPQFANITIAHNIIENNGPAQLQQDGGTYDNRGGGIYASNATVTVTNNVLRNNNANRGGGMFIASQSGFTVADNLIENNSGYDDHGGGVVLNPLPVSAAGNATFSRNVVRGNVAAKAFNYGYAGGVLIPGNLDPAGLKPVTLSNNTYTGNSAPSFGGAIFVDNGATVVLDHDLVYKNNTTRTDDGGAGGIYLDGDAGGPGTPPSGSFLTIQNSTIADNTSGTQVGNGVVVQENSRLTVTNSIFWGNTDDFSVDDTSTIAVTYTDSQEATPGTGNLSTDPLFANPATADYHLKSTGGRFDPAAQGGAGGFVLDSVNSPAIDAGDPASPFANETAPNGGRINLGFEGNTAQASRSASANPAAPTITGLNPGSGPAAGSTSVTITGTNFTGATAVSFGGTAALNFVVNSAMQITATSPAHAAGTVDVTVTNAGGTSATGQPDQYVYTAPVLTPRVTGLNPSNGPDAGGTSVTITGQNFPGVD